MLYDESVSMRPVLKACTRKSEWTTNTTVQLLNDKRTVDIEQTNVDATPSNSSTSSEKAFKQHA